MLDIKEKEKTQAGIDIEKAEEERKKRSPFFIYLEEFSLVKLRSTVYLIEFPLTFSICMISVWKDIKRIFDINNKDIEMSKNE